MEQAHVDAVMILGQVFDNNHEYYDFGGQDVTRRCVICFISILIFMLENIFYIIIILYKQDPDFSANYNNSQIVPTT